MNNINKLNKEGYLVIENKDRKGEFYNSLKDFYNNDNVNYYKVKEFINKKYFNNLKNKLKIREKLYYGKFRFSNNNNSSDASTFHGDIYNHTKENIIKIYTCLYYFDDAQLEIIPKSHRRDYLSNYNFYNSLKNKKILNINSGTMIIFHSNIHHRGINFTSGNRRLLQIFDVCLNKYDYYENIPKLKIVKTYNCKTVKLITELSKKIFRNNKNETLIFVHYFLVYYDLQYKVGIMSDLSPYDKKDKLISYEPGKRCYLNELDKIKETNINVICNTNIESCEPGNFYFYCYLSYNILFLIIYLFIIKIRNKNKK